MCFTCFRIHTYVLGLPQKCQGVAEISCCDNKCMYEVCTLHQLSLRNPQALQATGDKDVFLAGRDDKHTRPLKMKTRRRYDEIKTIVLVLRAYMKMRAESRSQHTADWSNHRQNRIKIVILTRTQQWTKHRVILT